jgi:hypothetical protein
MTEPIRAEPAAEHPAAPALSADGKWWWDGERWLSALSEDGLWRWDGARWQPAVELDGSDPEALLEALDRVVDAGYAEAGELLAVRAHEWRPANPELEDLVARAAPLAARLAAVDSHLAGLDSGGSRPSIRSLLGLNEREELETEAQRLEAELHPLAALIGRMAPVPSVREADEILAPTRRLDARVIELSEAVSHLRERALAREGSVAEARAALAAATAAREARLAELEDAVGARQDEHARAVAELTQALRRLRMPGAGAPLRTLGGITLYENRVDTPDGRGPVLDAVAAVGTAEELAAQHPDVVAELWLVEAEGAAALHDALATGSADRFLLVITSSVKSVAPVTDLGAAEALAAQLGELSAAAREGRPAWKRQVRAAEAALEAALADTTAVEQATAELERAREDPELLAPVREAEARLRREEAGGPEDAAARSRVAELVEELLRPPAAR